ncbi:hypothetical protein EV294_112109 [Paenibacillus sp. BK033]|uniref:hypothetical protein n=1 Tax=Paenibacillus sp. BK033 TaxID=2512133 RepID=UPI00104FC976|nr:hypothetical protein [Paenibacillus sp. BK033]TCM89644.1 hypothetical protein EV294_112109 [Paenibacillus sp. BK033]
MAKLNVVIPATNVIVDGVEYRKVDRDAQAGDIVRITDEDAHDQENLTRNGYYAVMVVDFFGDPHISDNDGDELDLCGWTYEAYEKVTEVAQPVEDGDTVTYEGKQYRKINRNANTGDTIIVTSWESSKHLPFNPTKIGDVFKSVKVDRDYDAHVGDYYVIYRSEYKVLEPVEAKADRLSVGDYVKVVDNLGSSGIPRGCTYIGEIRKIVEVDGSHVPYRAEKFDGSDYDWFREGKLVRATDEEVAAAKAALAAKSDPRNEFAKSDKVRLVSGGRDYPLNGYDNGKVYEVTEPIKHEGEPGTIEIKGGSVRTGYAKPEQLVKVTAEELAKEALTAKWAAIGRKVNEFKKGDIVLYVKNGKDVLGTVEDVSNSLLGVRVASTKLNDMSATYDAVYKVEHKATLVTPVEQRFDRVG